VVMANIMNIRKVSHLIAVKLRLGVFGKLMEYLIRVGRFNLQHPEW
jgi:hypothetical protein